MFQRPKAILIQSKHTLDIVINPSSLANCTITWAGKSVPANSLTIALDPMNDNIPVITLVCREKNLPKDLCHPKTEYIQYTINGSGALYGRLVALTVPDFRSGALQHERVGEYTNYVLTNDDSTNNPAS